MYDAFEWLANLKRKMREDERKGEPIKSYIEVQDEVKKRIGMLREEKKFSAGFRAVLSPPLFSIF